MSLTDEIDGKIHEARQKLETLLEHISRIDGLEKDFSTAACGLLESAGANTLAAEALAGLAKDLGKTLDILGSTKTPGTSELSGLRDIIADYGNLVQSLSENISEQQKQILESKKSMERKLAALEQAVDITCRKTENQIDKLTNLLDEKVKGIGVWVLGGGIGLFILNLVILYKVVIR